MRREVCLKHRKNRRETLQRVRTQFEFAAVFVLFVVSGAGISARAALAVSFQKSTIATHIVCGGRQLAQLGLQNLAGSGQHRGGGRE